MLYRRNVGRILPNRSFCVLFVSLQIAIVSNATDFPILFLNAFFIDLADGFFFYRRIVTSHLPLSGKDFI